MEKTELEKEKSRKDSGDTVWMERTRRTEAELDWAKEMAGRLDRVNQGLGQENQRLKGQFKSQEDDRKFLIRQLVSVKVCGPRARSLLKLYPASPPRKGSEHGAHDTSPNTAACHPTRS